MGTVTFKYEGRIWRSGAGTSDDIVLIYFEGHKDK
jgi:hypothetical protein